MSVASIASIVLAGIPGAVAGGEVKARVPESSVEFFLDLPDYRPMPDKRYYCAVEVTVDLIDGKWKPVILAHLKEGVRRYGELRRLMPSTSEKSG